jgi:metal-responsive CopG/Arc/MetJ family transcriptional regulator
MKVAVSIPDPVFSEAEALARRLNASRSEIYARALDAFVATHAPERVTEALNAVVAANGAEPDAFVRRAARQTLERAEW